MRIQSFLIQGAGSALAGKLGTMLSGPPQQPLQALVLLSLGVDHVFILDTVQQNQAALLRDNTAIYLSETYGILGFDEERNENVELMEKGRGSEYGYCGGSGGQGCLVIGYSDGAVAGHSSDIPPDISTLMVIADQSKSWAAVQAKAPLHYGGIAKAAWQIHLEKQDGEVSLVEVPFSGSANLLHPVPEPESKPSLKRQKKPPKRSWRTYRKDSRPLVTWACFPASLEA
jgi:hypothetical protein